MMFEYPKGIIYPNTNWRGVLEANRVVKNQSAFKVIVRADPAS